MKRLAIIPVVALLSACQTTDNAVIVQTKLEVVMPDSALYNCPITKYPDYKKLTDDQVARLLIQMHKNNKICRNSALSIKKFLEDSKKIIEEEH